MFLFRFVSYCIFSLFRNKRDRQIEKGGKREMGRREIDNNTKLNVKSSYDITLNYLFS